MKKLFTLLTFCLMTLMAFADKQVSGIVVDEQNEPVIGASIQVLGTSLGTITDYDGLFSLTVPDDATTLLVKYLGKKDQEVAIKSNVRVQLVEAAHEIQEVVAIGYGSVAKNSFAGSATAVSAENVEKKNPTEISKALTGEVAGVQVVNSNGQPGSNAAIRIRGLGSVNASSAPLYVVDGIPYDGDVSALDPSDIASTTILKDATATSLYGARAANGVVLITTKKGTSGEEGKIDVDLKYGANMRLLPMYETVSSPEDYLLLCWQGLYNIAGGTDAKRADYANRNLFGAIGIPEQYNIWNTAGNLIVNPYSASGAIKPSIASGVGRKAGYETMESWKDAIFRIGQKAEATVKIRGGSDKTTYYTSFGYLKDEGYYQASDFSRFTVRSNIEYKPKKWLKGTLNMSYAYSTMNNPDQSSSAANNGFLFINSIPAIYPVYQRNADGTIMMDPNTGGYAYDYGMYEGYGRPYSAGINPAGSLRLDKDKTTTHQVATTGSLEFRIPKVDGLKFTINVGEQYYGAKNADLTNKYYGDAAGVGYIANTSVAMLSLTANQLIEYNKTFGDHTVRLLAGHETNFYSYEYLYGYKAGLVEPNGTSLSNGVEMRSTEGIRQTSALESYLATVSYSYNDRYMLTANYRADGSSKFAKGHRWGHFGSVGFAWNLTNESFMQSVDWLKDTKLRLSWGVLGNQETGDYLFADHYSVENVNGNAGYVWSYRGNPDLTWERSQITDLGLEFAIDKYLTAEIDYFYKLTDNMLFSRYVAPSLGYAGYYTNDGKMANQGIEFQFNVHAVDERNVKLDIRLNGSHYANKMTQMPVDYYDENGNAVRMVMSSGMSVGHSLYDWYMPEYAGVNPETGLAQYWVYYDADKGTFNPSSIGFEEATGITSGDNYIASLHEYQLKNPNANIQRVAVEGSKSTYATSTYSGKSGIPDLAGGFGFDLEVYGVTLSAFCSYGIGGYGYDNTYAALMGSGRAGEYNWHVDMFNAWTPTNTNTDIPRLSNNTDTYANMGSTRFLTSNSYLSLNSINLGYKFPKKWIEKIKFENLSVWVSAENLAIATARKGYNPMVSLSGTSSSSQYTPLSTIMGGVRFSF